MDEIDKSDVWSALNVWRAIKGSLWIIAIVAFAVIAAFSSTVASMFGKPGTSSDANIPQ